MAGPLGLVTNPAAAKASGTLQTEGKAAGQGVLSKDALPLGLSGANYSFNSRSQKSLVPVLDLSLGSFTSIDSLKNLALEFDIPPDLLSFTLLKISRLFSAPLDGKRMQALRREILSRGGMSQPALAAEKAALEMDALALLALADKGLALSDDDISAYVFAMDADRQRKEGGRKNEEEKARQEKLLRRLNQARGENNQKWIVLPFTFTNNGVELSIVLKALIKVENTSAESVLLLADIESPSGAWRFTLTREGGAGKKLLIEGRGRQTGPLLESALEFFAGQGFAVSAREYRDAVFCAEEFSAPGLPDLPDRV
jgi:hypothetical protein